MSTAEVVLAGGEKMLIDSDCLSLFSNIKLYAVKSRNCVYASFGKNGRAHRLICGVTDKNLVVDHINGNGLDNRKCNLRVVDAVTNVRNRQFSRAKESGLPPGVFRFRNGYMVQVTHKYKKIFVGTFSVLDEAISALNAKRLELRRPKVKK